MAPTFGGCRVVLRTGDLTLDDADAIVNAANPSLLGGGGVDGAIHARGGPEILEACRRIRAERGGAPLPPGEAVITPGGRLAARHVIHTVGPIFDEHPDPDACLAAAYRACLDIAAARGFRTVAFPSLSTGAYGFPIERAAPIALRTVRDRLLEGGHGLAEVRFVLFSDAARRTFETALEALA